MKNLTVFLILCLSTLSFAKSTSVGKSMADQYRAFALDATDQEVATAVKSMSKACSIFTSKEEEKRYCQREFQQKLNLYPVKIAVELTCNDMFNDLKRKFPNSQYIFSKKSTCIYLGNQAIEESLIRPIHSEVNDDQRREERKRIQETIDRINNSTKSIK